MGGGRLISNKEQPTWTKIFKGQSPRGQAERQKLKVGQLKKTVLASTKAKYAPVCNAATPLQSIHSLRDMHMSTKRHPVLITALFIIVPNRNQYKHLNRKMDKEIME